MTPGTPPPSACPESVSKWKHADPGVDQVVLLSAGEFNHERRSVLRVAQPQGEPLTGIRIHEHDLGGLHLTGGVACEEQFFTAIEACNLSGVCEPPPPACVPTVLQDILPSSATVGSLPAIITLI